MSSEKKNEKDISSCKTKIIKDTKKQSSTQYSLPHYMEAFPVKCNLVHPVKSCKLDTIFNFTYSLNIQYAPSSLLTSTSAPKSLPTAYTV